MLNQERRHLAFTECLNAFEDGYKRLLYVRENLISGTLAYDSLDYLALVEICDLYRCILSRFERKYLSKSLLERFDKALRFEPAVFKNIYNVQSETLF